MRYIIIGGSGFVGTYTINALSEAMFKKHIESGELICVDCVQNVDINTKFYHCDLTKGFDFELKEDDVIIHLAARAYAPKPPLKPFGTKALESYFDEVNVKGTQAILQQMQKAKANKLIYFSTDMVYGKPQYLPVDSKHRRMPFGYYGASKVKSEDLIFKARNNGINACIFRPRIIVGAGRFGILTKLFTLIDNSLPVPLIGNGNNCYQMISVQDCAKAIICAIQQNFPNNQYNLGSHNPPKIKDLLYSLIKLSGSKSLLVPTYAKGIKCILEVFEQLGIPLMYKEQYAIADEQYIVDISQTQNDLHWDPTYSDVDMLFEAYTTYIRCKKGK